MISSPGDPDRWRLLDTAGQVFLGLVLAWCTIELLWPGITLELLR